MNTFKTGMLLAALTALFMGLGLLIGGPRGALFALVVAAGLNLFAYWNADKMVLRMHGAREVDERSAPGLVRLVRDLSARAGMATPKVYIVDSPHPNAFATGRNPENAAVAATTGLLQMLTPDELAGVMAHELAHVKNRDTLIMTVTATIAGAVSMLTNFAMFFGGRGDGERMNPIALIGLMIAAPLAAALVQMAISRTREYAADRLGAEICGRPRSLAAALQKLASGVQRVPNPVVQRNPAAAHLYIVHPALGGAMDSLFSTHPDTANRIAALETLAAEMGDAAPPRPRPFAVEPASALKRAQRQTGAPRARSALDPVGRPSRGPTSPWS